MFSRYTSETILLDDDDDDDSIIMGKDKAKSKEAAATDDEDASESALTTIYQDEAAAHIRQNNDTPLSPTPFVIPGEKKDKHKHRKHHHHHNKHHHHKEKHKDDMKSPKPTDTPVKTPRSSTSKRKELVSAGSKKGKRHSGNNTGGAMPPAVPNLAEILSDPADDEKMPHRQAR